MSTQLNIEDVHWPVRADWLALRDETPLEPDLPIVDPHHHLWTKPGRHYLVPEFQTDIGANNVRATVFVECHEHYRTDGDPIYASVGETEFIAGIAGKKPGSKGRGAIDFCAGIVGNATLQTGDRIKGVLEAHIEAGQGRFRGVRNISAWHSDPAARGSLSTPPRGLLADAKFREGFACLAPLKLAFDAYMYHTQLPELRDLARAFPDTPIVVDHSGGPLGIGPYRDKRKDVFEAWSTDMAALAECQNVHVKVGGFALRAFGLNLPDAPLPPTSDHLADAWRPYIEMCIAEFGTNRCMFESNFPVDKGGCSYTVMWNAFKRVTSNYSASERADLFGGTAARFYRLPAVDA